MLYIFKHSNFFHFTHGKKSEYRRCASLEAHNFQTKSDNDKIFGTAIEHIVNYLNLLDFISYIFTFSKNFDLTDEKR